jgi:diguanylate cyclase (GGDEF)-like protein
MERVSNIPDGLVIVGELGRGAENTVYRARRDGADYALKLLHGAGDEQALIGFRREAALLARVGHPGVPKVFDVGLAGGRPYLVMELVDGRPLADRLAAGPLAVPELVRLATDVAAALHAAHGAGLVHRDVKPENIIIAGAGQARLIDFGLAAGRRGPAGDAVVGTFGYSAPEQTGMLARPVDGRADLYALGVVLFQCATGRLPFHAGDVGDLLAMHATAPVPDPRAERPDLPDGLAEVILRLLAKDPDDRVPTARDLHAELRRAAAAPDGSGIGVNTSGDLPEAGTPAGRHRERKLLADSWARARAGRGGVVLVEGPSGVGKTSLARAVLREARAAGALVLAGKCDADSPLPLAPLRQAVDGILRTVTALPAADRAAAVADLRTAAGVDSGLLRPLSPVLAALLDAPRPATEDRPDQYAGAVASFLSALAVRHGGLVLLVDDVQWLDAASREVMRRLAGQTSAAPLLLIATARDGDPHAEAVAAFAADMGDRLDLRLPLRPLDDAGAAQLIAAYLPGATVTPEMAAELIGRGRGNPFTILEYLHALIEAGALRPSWGTWRLDRDRLHSIDLPDDVIALVLARVDGLSPQAHEALTVAAALGARFDPGLVGHLAVTGAAAALAEAVDRGLVRCDGAAYAFVHDRIREAVLSPLDPPSRQALHRRIAATLVAQGGTDPPNVYAVARHYAAGGLDHDPDRIYATGRAAGQLALAEHAPGAAVAFLETAADGARAAGIRPESRFHEVLAAAYLSAGDAGAAGRQLEPALAAETVPMRRAALFLQLAHVRRTEGESAAAVECARAGLAELGTPMPRTKPALFLRSVWSAGWWLAAGSRRPARRPARGAEAERLGLHAKLCRAGAASAAGGLRHALAFAFSMRGIRRVHRLGRSVDYATNYAAMGLLLSWLRLHKRKRRLLRQIGDIAADLGDPQLSAHLAWLAAFGDRVGRTGTVEQWAQVCEDNRRWLEADHYVEVVLLKARDLIARGYAEEALTWCDRARGRVAESTAERHFALARIEAMARGLLGQATGGPPVPAGPGEHRPGHPGVGQAALAAITAAYLAVEQDELGEPFDAAIAAFDRLSLRVFALPAEDRMLFVTEAFGRLAGARRAGERERAEALAAAAAGVRRLGQAAGSGLSRGYFAVAQASLWQLRGRPDRALAALARAERRLVRLDAPLVHYEAARVRARALAELGAEAPARRQAEEAGRLAVTFGWVHRAGWVRTEFGQSAVRSRADGATGDAASSRRTSRQAEVTESRYRRRLEALQQVSAAAAAVLDPQRLARVALDETLRILGAERAILFLLGDDGRPRPSLGRTADGELSELTGFSASLVERVAADRTPLVVAGSEQGAALGSRSTVVHGLRSIMIAPLELEGRLLGVVYLDSRLAKGVFTADDIDLLAAVTSQVAVSLETARAAQLEAAVRAARQQRDTAEALRAAANELAATLDPRQVLDSVCAIAARTLPADRVWLLHQDGGLTVAGPDLADPPDVAALTPTGPLGGDAAGAPEGLRAMLDGARCWLTAPFVTRGHGGGVLIAVSAAVDEFGPAHLDIAAAIAGQGATAYTNARLFAQVQHLATTAGRPGVLNRRHFADLAASRLADAAALMVDIDHFKKINDTYGHSTGDDVIRAVAGVLAARLPAPALLCRYGGEEFAVLAGPELGDPVALAEGLRVAVESLAVPGPAGPVRVTVSIGVAEVRPGDPLDGLLARADEALYRAKHAGRNTVRAAEAPVPSIVDAGWPG